jgi:ParB-like chromosome segregation protein Spo0J
MNNGDRQAGSAVLPDQIPQHVQAGGLPQTDTGTGVGGAPDPPGQIIATLPVSMLLPGESPRLEGYDEAHVARLAEVDGQLPPIVVEPRTMRVIDGTHRLMAAIRNGRDTIEAIYYEGSPEDTFLHAVHANVVHGFPLSQADRRAAASRIIDSHPYLSDRAIAEVAGLGAKTVATIRRRSQDDAARPKTRIGRDGRARPLNGSEGRHRVAELLTKHPDASLRELARLAGVSPATVSDVRTRLERGEAPETVRPPRRPQLREVAVVGQLMGKPERTVEEQRVDASSLLDKLLRDPALRHKEEGRELLRLLQQNAIGSQKWDELTAVVPSHCGGLVGQLAQQYAKLWSEFAREMARQARTAA